MKICAIDEASGLCCGCGRSLAEIGAWSGLGAAARRAIMADLPRRIGDLPPPPLPGQRPTTG